MVYEDLYKEEGSKEILSSFFKAMNNGQQLLIKDIIVAFSG